MAIGPPQPTRAEREVCHGNYPGRWAVSPQAEGPTSFTTFTTFTGASQAPWIVVRLSAWIGPPAQGIMGAAVAIGRSFQPNLLTRGSTDQAIITGASSAIAYQAYSAGDALLTSVASRLGRTENPVVESQAGYRGSFGCWRFFRTSLARARTFLTRTGKTRFADFDRHGGG